MNYSYFLYDIIQKSKFILIVALLLDSQHLFMNYLKVGMAREQACITQSKKRLIWNITGKDYKRWSIWGIKRNIMPESREITNIRGKKFS